MSVYVRRASQPLVGIRRCGMVAVALPSRLVGPGILRPSRGVAASETPLGGRIGQATIPWPLRRRYR